MISLKQITLQELREIEIGLINHIVYFKNYFFFIDEKLFYCKKILSYDLKKLYIFGARP